MFMSKFIEFFFPGKTTAIWPELLMKFRKLRCLNWVCYVLFPISFRMFCFCFIGFWTFASFLDGNRSIILVGLVLDCGKGLMNMLCWACLLFYLISVAKWIIMQKVGLVSLNRAKLLDLSLNCFGLGLLVHFTKTTRILPKLLRSSCLGQEI